ncbi:MAG: hypothetical protein M1837_004597 [Sclerophora amabilis]|nr:MAG: hypothetical protein M1837_004597 [Sclerophora amabilis]
MAVSESTFEAYILRSPHRDLLRRLSSFFVSHIQDRLGPDVLEAAALRGDFKIGSFEEVGWSAALDDLPPASAKEVLDCLVEFHKNHPTIDLADIQVSDLTREITIPVDVPNVQVLHTVDLCVLGFDPDTSSNPRIAAVGQMLPAELRIAHTRTWDQDQMHNAATPPDWDDAIEFNYEIHANPDSWIIGGRRRSKFAAKAQELLTFPVMLIPLKPGHLLLPSIDIAPVVAWSGPPGPNDAPSSHEFSGITSHPRASLSVSSDEKRSSFLSESRGGISRDYAAPVKPPLACEVQCRSQAQSILVLPNVRSATVSLDYLTPEGGASLVASERRVDEVS